MWHVRATLLYTTKCAVRMACASKVSIQDLVKSCGVEEASLDREVTYECFYEISSYLTQWKRIAPKLDISKVEVEAIESEHQKAEMQRVLFLDTWKQRMSFMATYRVLVDAMLSAGRAEDARGVCKTLTGKHITASCMYTYIYSGT